MDKKSIFFLLLFCLFGTAFSQNGYNIKLKVNGIEDSVAYLGYHYGNKKYVQDTSVVEKSGQVIFKGDKRLKKGVYFLYSPKFYMEFLVVDQNFSIETSKNDIYGKMKIEGSDENVIFKNFQIMMQKYQSAIKALSNQLENAKSKDDSTNIYTQVKKLRTLNITNRDNLEKENSNTYTATLLRLIKSPKELKIDSDSITIDQRKEQYAYYKSHFFDGIDFDDEGTIRTPVFHNKVVEFLEQVTIQNPDSIISSLDYILDKSKNNEEIYRYWLVSSFQKYQNTKIMGMDKVFLHLGDNYYLKGKAPWSDDEMIKKLKDELIFYRENQIGMIAPQLNLLDTLFKPIKLHNIEAKYMILYFYSPTCGHCKKKTSGMVKLFHDFKEEGLQIMGVNVDTEVDKWLDFIKDFELDWVNTADISYKSNFRIQYNVRSTPTIYLLDKEKKIIAKKLDAEQLRDLLEKLIAFDKNKKVK